MPCFKSGYVVMCEPVIFLTLTFLIYESYERHELFILAVHYDVYVMDGQVAELQFPIYLPFSPPHG
jgi:hypothetical protein